MIMRKDVPPQKISNLQVFPTFVSDDASSADIFKISKDGAYVWITHGCTLEVFTCPKLRRINHWGFPSLAKNPDVYICALEEFPSGGGPGGYRASAAPHLLVALSGVNLLCLFDICSGRVFKCIQLPMQVSSLEVIASQGGACLQTLPLCPDLRLFFGTVAVGTISGELLLVDLSLDELQRSNENAPAQSFLVGCHSPQLSLTREQAIEHNEHICLALTVETGNHGHFVYKGPQEKILGLVDIDAAGVTSLLYVPQATLLTVGFKFGSFQLWDLHSLSILYSSPLSDDASPAIRFAFQEPENDPRNYCYLWVICGQDTPITDSEAANTTAYLYSLSYEKKDWQEGLGFLYKDFNHCVPRFEHPLTVDPYNNSHVAESSCSRLVTFGMIQDSRLANSRQQDIEEPQADEWSNQDLSLCLMVWEAWEPPEPPGYFMTLFDINQWYQAQMPDTVRRTGVCPFLGVFSLHEVMEKQSLLSPDYTLQDIYVPLRSLRRFRTLSPVDEMYYPSAFGFKATCLTDMGVIEVSYLGTQKQLLWELQKLGPAYLRDPTELFLHCHHSGLLSHSESASINQKREALLSLALEHDLLSYLKECVLQAPTVDHHSGGFSLRFLTDWAWKRAAHIKATIDRLCVQLFNCSGQELDERTLDALYNYSAQLYALSCLYQIMQFRAMQGITQTGFEDLSMQAEVVQLVSIYLKVILWLHTYCRLLPEHAEGEAYGENEVAYPATLLATAYSQRRLDLHRLHSSVGPTDLLLIDGLMTKLGEQVPIHWDRGSNSMTEGNGGGQRLYPPPNLFAFVNIYLVRGVPLMDKHCLTLYLLLDMADFLSHKQSHLEERLMQFPSAFGMPPSIVKIIQGFWMLDRKDFTKATSFLTDPVICSSDLDHSHHTRVVKSLLFQGQERLALRYVNIRQPPLDSPENIKLRLSLLLSNRLIGHAYNFQRQCSDEDLLNHFFLGCQQTGNMVALLELPLNPTEEQAFIKFMSESSHPKSKEMLIIYFLQRHRPLEALEFTDKLNRKTTLEDSGSFCASLVSQFIKILPPAQVRLFKELSKQMPNTALTSGRASVKVSAAPLSSLSIRKNNLEEPVSLSSNYRGLVEALSGTWNKPPVEAQTPLRSNRSRFSDIWTLQSMPFVGTPSAQKTPKKTDSDLVYATPVGKRASSSLLDVLESPRFPSKKSRSMDIVSPMKRVNSERRENRTLNAEAQRLLQTPPIKRQLPQLRVKSPGRAIGSLTATPQSILKPTLSSRTPDVEIVYPRKVQNALEQSEGTGNISETDMELEEASSGSVNDEDLEEPFPALSKAVDSSPVRSDKRLTDLPSLSFELESPSFHKSDDIVFEDDEIALNISMQHRRMDVGHLGRKNLRNRARAPDELFKDLSNMLSQPVFDKENTASKISSVTAEKSVIDLTDDTDPPTSSSLYKQDEPKTVYDATSKPDMESVGSEGICDRVEYSNDAAEQHLTTEVPPVSTAIVTDILAEVVENTVVLESENIPETVTELHLYLETDLLDDDPGSPRPDSHLVLSSDDEVDVIGQNLSPFQSGNVVYGVGAVVVSDEQLPSSSIIGEIFEAQAVLDDRVLLFTSTNESEAFLSGKGESSALAISENVDPIPEAVEFTEISVQEPYPNIGKSVMYEYSVNNLCDTENESVHHVEPELDTVIRIDDSNVVEVGNSNSQSGKMSGVHTVSEKTEETCVFYVPEPKPCVPGLNETGPFVVQPEPNINKTGCFDVLSQDSSSPTVLEKTGPFEVQISESRLETTVIKERLRKSTFRDSVFGSKTQQESDSAPTQRKALLKAKPTRRRVQESIVPVQFLPTLTEYSPPASEEQSPSSSVFTTPEKSSPSTSWNARLRPRSESRTSSDSSPQSVNNSVSKKGQSRRRTSTPSPQLSSPFPQPTVPRKTVTSGRKGTLDRDKQLTTDILPPCTIPEEPEELPIDECLTPKTALPFVFSPPATRSRVRRKKSDTPDSSFPPSESKPQGIGLLPGTRSSKTRQDGEASTEGAGPPWEDYINLISPFPGTKPRRSSVASRTSTSSRHSMTLRAGHLKSRKVVKLK